MAFDVKKIVKVQIIKIGLFSIGLMSIANADIPFLDQYFQKIARLESNFSQSVQQGKNTELSTGHLLLNRDIGFKFIYEKPFKQEIILNKSYNRLWQFDHDLSQVIIKTIDLNNQNNPISFLLSAQPISQSFDIKVEKNNVSYILTPKNKKRDADELSGISKLKIIFKNNLLSHFTATDDTGSSVTITLLNPVFNGNILLSNFIFNAASYPKVDIIDETK